MPRLPSTVFGAGDVQVHAQQLAEAGHGQGHGRDGFVAGRKYVDDTAGRFAAGGIQDELGWRGAGRWAPVRDAAPFSKRWLASVRRLSSVAVRRLFRLWNVADSSSMFLVEGVISLFAPPITPPMPMAWAGSAISRLSELRSPLHFVQGGELFAVSGAAHHYVVIGDGIQVEKRAAVG